MDRSNKKFKILYKSMTASTSAMAISILHIPPTNLLLAAKQQPYKKAYLLTKNIKEFAGKSSAECSSRQKRKKKEDRKSNRTRQKNKTGDSKVESNDLSLIHI